MIHSYTLSKGMAIEALTYKGNEAELLKFVGGAERGYLWTDKPTGHKMFLGSPLELDDVIVKRNTDGYEECFKVSGETFSDYLFNEEDMENERQKQLEEANNKTASA